MTTTFFPVGVTNTPYTTEIDYSSGTNPIYIGIALPGSALSGAVWQIKKMIYDSNGNVTTVQWADSGNFSQIWNNRASLSYS